MTDQHSSRAIVENTTTHTVTTELYEAAFATTGPRNCSSLGTVHPNAPARAGDKAVHRDANGVDQHGFKPIAPDRRTMIAMTFTLELDIGLSFLPQAALPRLVTDRETTTGFGR